MADRTHFDFASTAPIRPEVMDVMYEAIKKEQFDPRRLYNDAINRRYEIEESRIQVANYFDCDPSEIIFCSSSTEALAIFASGVVPSPDIRFRQSGNLDNQLNFAITPYDSEIVSETWSRENVSLEVIPGNADATLDMSAIKRTNWSNINVVSLPYAHPDTGTLLQVEKIIEEIKKQNPGIYIHVDARSASGYTKLSFNKLNIDAMTVESCTWGGPVGVSALIAKIGTIAPFIPGTTQERGRRGGIENFPAIKAFGYLCYENMKSLEFDLEKYQKYDQKIRSVLQASGAILIPSQSDRLLNVMSAYFKGIAASVIVTEFNSIGINIHAGSSCGSEEFEPSKALAPVTGNDDISETVFRISWGWSTTDEDIEKLVSAIETIANTYS